MNGVLNYQLFRIGQTQVTLASLLVTLAILVATWLLARALRVRFDLPVSVACGSDPRAVEQALLEAAAKNKHVLREPAPTVLFAAFGESSLDFELAGWTAVMLHRRSALRSEMNHAIHAALTGRGIELPFPQRDIHIRSAEGLEGLRIGERGRS